jgi:hypothetical protein
VDASAPGNRRRLIAGLLVLAALAGLGLGALLWSGGAGATGAGREFLLVQPTAAGRLEARGGDRYRLVLSAPDPRTAAFADRPDRQVSSFPSDTLPTRWSSGGFTADPPNAALLIEPGGLARSLAAGPQTLTVELTDPDFDYATGDLSFDARLLGSEGRPTRRFDKAVLFIDGADAGAVEDEPPAAQVPTAPLPSQGIQAIERAAGQIGSILEGPQVGRLPAAASQAAQNVQELLSQIERESHEGGEVSLATMFQLQFQMQIMSQYVEAVSNTLAAIHQEMLTMARATKGQ